MTSEQAVRQWLRTPQKEKEPMKKPARYWDDEIKDAANQAKDATKNALKAAEKARQEINVLVHLASKHGIGRIPMLSPIRLLDMKLHKTGSPSELYAAGVRDLDEVAKKIKGG